MSKPALETIIAIEIETDDENTKNDDLSAADAVDVQHI